MKRILVAYDGQKPASRALATTIEMAKALGATVGVVSVVPTRPGRSPVDPWDDRDVHARALVDAQHMLRQAGIEPEVVEPSGDVATMIERIAADGDYDTIVVGSRGLGAVGRVLQGSISEHVATHADATVVIAR